MKKINLQQLRGDIYGGITAAVVALPLALAFGVASGAGPAAGLYGAIFVGFFAAVFGGTPAQISGPTGPMTVVMASIFTHYSAYDPEHGPWLAFTVVMMGGVLQIGMGLLKLGKYINLMPYAVISGFMSGIGVIIIILQLGPLLGYAAPPGGVLAALSGLPAMFSQPVWDAVLLGLLTLCIVYLTPQSLQRLIPSPLLALVVGTAALLWLLPQGQATQLGDIPTGFPQAHLPLFDWNLLIDMFKSALVLAVLGAIDSLLTSLVADNMTRSFHDSNRELIGQGIGNTVAGLFGGLPGAGATMRTVVNIRSGGSSPISGALHAVLLLALALGAGSVAEHIPHAVLAGILIKVGVDIIDWNFMIHLRQTTLTSTLLMLVVLLVTVFVDLITAVGVGVVVASLLLVQRMADLQMISSQLFSSPKDAAPLSPQERELLGQAQGKILLYHLSGPLSFGAARDMVKRVAGYQSHQVLLLDLTDVPLMDYTSARAIGDIIRDNESAAKQVYLVGLHPSLESLLQKTKILDSVLLEHRYACRYDALQHALKNNIGSGRV